MSETIKAMSYLIYSHKHQAYYGPDFCGYSNRLNDPNEPIGRYTKADAEAEVERVNYDPASPILEVRVLHDAENHCVDVGDASMFIPPSPAPIAGKAEMPEILMCPDCDIPAYIHPGVTETGTGGAYCKRCGRGWGEAVAQPLDAPCDLSANRTDEHFTCMQRAGHDGSCDMVVTGKGMKARDKVGRDKMPGLEEWTDVLRIARSMQAEGVWSMKPGEPSQGMGCVLALVDDRERLLDKLECAEHERDEATIAYEKTVIQRDMARNELAGERRSHEILANLRRNQLLFNAALKKECDAMRKLVTEAIGWDEDAIDGFQLAAATAEYRASTPTAESK